MESRPTYRDEHDRPEIERVEPPDKPTFHSVTSHTYPAVHASGHSRPHLGDSHYYFSGPPEPSLVERVSSSLFFPELRLRYDSIEESISDTFEWVTKPPNNVHHQWDSFVQWLQGDGKTYWISGKPGSGKSTLMKHLFEHLNSSSDTSQPNLVLVSFWFWEASKVELQHNLEGCLRSMLWQLVQNTSYGKTIARHIENFTQVPWTCERLLKAFNTSAENLSEHDVLLTIFWDGLDECGKDARRLLRGMKEIVGKCPSIKFCISSRPEQLFRNYFFRCPKLSMQDLNASDIDTIISKELLETEEFLQLSDVELEDVQRVREQIQSKAQGAILWVLLAVRDLVQGIGNRDTLAELTIRLERMPSELDGLYGLMLQRNSDDTDDYMGHCALYCRLACIGQMNLVEFWLATNDDIRKAYLKCGQGWETLHMNLDDQRLISWINVRAKGLIEVRYRSDCYIPRYPPRDPSLRQRLASRALEVGFIHRTARTFVLDTVAGLSILSASSKSDSDVREALWESQLIDQLILTTLDSAKPCGLEILPVFLFHSSPLAHLNEAIRSTLKELLNSGLIRHENNQYLQSGRLARGFDENLSFPGVELHGIDYCELFVLCRQWQAAKAELLSSMGKRRSEDLTYLVYCTIRQMDILHERKKAIDFLGRLFEAGADPNSHLHNLCGEDITLFHYILYLVIEHKIHDPNVEQWLLKASDSTFDWVMYPSVQHFGIKVLSKYALGTTYIVGSFSISGIAPFIEGRWTQSLKSRTDKQKPIYGRCVILCGPLRENKIFGVEPPAVENHLPRLLSSYQAKGAIVKSRVGLIQIRDRAKFILGQIS